MFNENEMSTVLNCRVSRDERKESAGRKCYRPYAHRICLRIVSDHMRNFSDKKLCRIDAYRARIVGAILRIVSDFPRTVRPKVADTNFGRSLSLLHPFLVTQWAGWYFEKVVRRW